MSGVVWAFCIFIILGVFSMYLQEKNKLPMALAPEYVLTLAEVYDDNLTIQAGEFSTTRSYRFAAWTKYNQDATDKRTGALIILRGDVFIAENLSYAHQMIKALTHHWGNVFGPFLAFTNQTENPGFDELYMNEDYQDHGQIIARKGNYVYHIIYIQDGEKILYALYKQASNIK